MFGISAKINPDLEVRVIRSIKDNALAYILLNVTSPVVEEITRSKK